MAKRICIPWSEQELSVLQSNYEQHGPVWCREYLLAAGHPERTAGAIYQQCYKLGLVYDGRYKTRFQPGSIPPNKGKKMSEEVKEKSKHTRFKKGQIPGNKKPVGSEVFRSEGYLYVKMGDGTWEKKHRVIWESHHGPIPKGHLVRFKNSNPLDCRIENLELITRAEHGPRCRWDQASEYTLISGRSARLWLKQKGVKNKEITPEMMQMAKIKVLVTNQKRVK